MKQKANKVDKGCAIAMICLTPIFFIAVSALIPCIFRPFYYMFIDPLKIPQTSGYSRSTIIGAYNDIMNFIWRGAPFKTGSLAYTEAEKSHFADCIPLFHLQLILALVIGTLIIMYILLLKKNILIKVRFKGLSPFVYGGFISISLLAIVGIFAAINFNALFTVFHHIAFPGKGNWIFDYDTEQVIKILPESFFAVCAVFIISMVVILSTIVIVYGFMHKEKKHELRNSSSDEQQA